MTSTANFDVTGRVAIVTGSTKGLGRAIAEGLAAAGCHVVVSSRKQDACEAVARDIETRHGVSSLGHAWHAGDWDGAESLVTATYERFGRIDILVNNAGINPGGVRLVDMTQALWDKVFEVNLRGPLRLAALVAPVMAIGGGGSVINISSFGAYRAGSGNSHYAASKAALLSLTQAMATEWASMGVRVNALSPGPFLTEMTKGGEAASPGFLDLSAGATLLKRVADASEIVGPVIYLASDASSFVTGEDHIVSGGMLR